MMSPPAPHYLLFSESSHPTLPCPRGEAQIGQWRFVLESLNDSAKLEVSDREEGLPDDRLELLAVVRGLEALPQPSRVTLVTTSRYVSRGMRFGLVEWRENGWQWESFGQMSPIKNADLWQRLDRALGIHEVRWRTLRFDRAHDGPAGEPLASRAADEIPVRRIAPIRVPVETTDNDVDESEAMEQPRAPVGRGQRTSVPQSCHVGPRAPHFMKPRNSVAGRVRRCTQRALEVVRSAFSSLPWQTASGCAK